MKVDKDAGVFLVKLCSKRLSYRKRNFQWMHLNAPPRFVIISIALTTDDSTPHLIIEYLPEEVYLGK